MNWSGFRSALAASLLLSTPQVAWAEDGDAVPFGMHYCPGGWSVAEAAYDGFPESVTWCANGSGGGDDSSPIMSEMRLFDDGCPRGWMLAAGATLSIASYQALFALLGPSYGGDGMRTFNLPNVTDAPDGERWCFAISGTFPAHP